MNRSLFPKRNPNSSSVTTVANSWSAATIRRLRPTLNHAIGSSAASFLLFLFFFLYLFISNCIWFHWFKSILHFVCFHSSSSDFILSHIAWSTNCSHGELTETEVAAMIWVTDSHALGKLCFDSLDSPPPIRIHLSIPSSVHFTTLLLPPS